MNNQQIVGNIGLYYVCYKLSRMGWNAMPTARNARGVDIIAYNFDCSRMISIQVKALSRKNPVPLGTSLDRVMGDFWVIVNDVVNDPKSYKHVETRYSDMKTHLIVVTKFRGKNAFGALVLNQISAKVDLNGNVIGIIDQQP